MAGPGAAVDSGGIWLLCPHCNRIVPQRRHDQAVCALCEKRGHRDWPDDCPACTGLGAEAGHA